jgi:hypothetical protein
MNDYWQGFLIIAVFDCKGQSTVMRTKKENEKVER